jgi:hypothetical protein
MTPDGPGLCPLPIGVQPPPPEHRGWLALGLNERRVPAPRGSQTVDIHLVVLVKYTTQDALFRKFKLLLQVYEERIVHNLLLLD